MTSLSLGSHTIEYEHWKDITWSSGDFQISHTDFLMAIRATKTLTSEQLKLLASLPWDTETVKLHRWMVTEKGVYVGAWTKRLLKYLKNQSISVDAQSIATIAEKVTSLTAPLRTPLRLAFVRRADWRPGEYGESTDSCWFGSDTGTYSWARNSLLNNGGGAVLLHSHPSDEPRARAWFMPLYPRNIAIFNAYDRKGILKLPSFARLLSTVYGIPYRMANDTYAGTAYVNGGNVYILGDPLITRPVTLLFGYKKQSESISGEDILRNRITDGTTNIYRAECVCYECHGDIPYVLSGTIRDIHEHGWIVDGERLYCNECYDFLDAPYCSDCETKSLGLTTVNNDDDHAVCEACRKEYYFCYYCDEYYDDDHSTWLSNYERTVCNDCYEEKYVLCGLRGCDNSVYIDDGIHDYSIDALICSHHDTYSCDDCGDNYSDDGDLTTVYEDEEKSNSREVCETCLNSHHWCNECDGYFVDSHSHEDEEEDEDEDDTSEI